MSYDPHLRAVISGGIWGTDRWTSGFQIDSGTGISPSQAEGDNLVSSITAWVEQWVDESGSGVAQLGAQVTFDRVQLYWVGTSGQALAQWEGGPDAAVAGAGTTIHPAQVAVVASLRTGVPGRARRGRMYLPCLAASAASAGVLPVETAQGIATGIAEVLTGINGDASSILDASARVVVASGVGTGNLTPVTSVLVGRVFDTQRRRRSDFVENYQSSPVTVP